MKILAIDTTAKTAAGAICDGDKTLCAFAVTGGFTHSETMLPEVDRLFEKSGLAPKDIDMFAVSAGPGSFTGVRIGVSLIKGLAFGRNVPCVGVSSLDALSENGVGIGGKFIACPVMDARRSQLYNALFLIENGKKKRLCEDRLISSSDLANELSDFSLPIYFFGDGYKIAKAAFPAAQETPEELILQSAPSVAAVAHRIYENATDKNIFTDLALSPSYLRPSQAEREYNEKKGEERK